MSEKKNGGVTLLKWWPLIVVAFVSAAAWGGNTVRTNDHSRRIEVNEKQLKDLIENKGRIDANTKAIQRSQKRTETDVRAILRYIQSNRPR